MKRSEMIPVYENKVQYELNNFIIDCYRSKKIAYTPENRKIRDSIVEGHEPVEWWNTLTLEERITQNKQIEEEMMLQEINFDLDENNIDFESELYILDDIENLLD